ASVELLREGISPPPGPEARLLEAELRRIEAATARMQEQVRELVDLARAGAGQGLQLVRAPTDLVRLAREATEQRQRKAGPHGLRLEEAVPALVGDWDAGRLRRVLDNLLGNAIKYSPAGGEVAVWLGHEAGAGGGRARLTVRDRGIGIPAAELPRVFEP